MPIRHMLFVLLLFPLAAAAAVLDVTPVGPSPQTVLDKARPGDTIRFAPGHYRANLVVNKRLILEGQAGVVLDGGREGDVLRVRAADTVIRKLRIINSGFNLTKMNAGIFVEPDAARVLIEHNELDHVAFGIWLDGCRETRILHNRIHGDPTIRSQDRGNGIHLYNVYEALVADNEIWETRDAIYIDTSYHNTLRNNVMHDLRYGVHYMYSFHNKVLDNLTYATRTGYALMQSKHLTVVGNRSRDDLNYGILLNFITDSEIRNNTVERASRGLAYASGGADVLGAEGKAIFIYNSVYNEIHDNLFTDSEIGIHITAGSEYNPIYGNAFVNNQTQVKYVANRTQEWSRAGRGNYWSDYLGWDRNADGVGDLPYEPNDAVDKLLWKYPLSRVLMTSPAVETLRWVQQQFPVLRPQGVRDSHPLMSAPSQAGVAG